MNLHVREPQVMAAMAQAHRGELVEAMKQSRRANMSPRRGPLCAALVRLGEMMVTAGEQLRERYAPIPEPSRRLELEYW